MRASLRWIACGLAVALFMLALTPVAFAQPNTPKLVWGAVTTSTGGVPAPGDVTFTAYIQTRPGDTLTQDSNGCGVETVGLETEYR